MAAQPHMNLEALLEEARKRIQVEPEELDEAKRRRKSVKDALLKEFPDGRVYNNGSVAHGDALTPLTDVDVGIVVPDPSHEYGPGRQGPHTLKDRAADAVRRELKAEYGDLRVQVEGRKRSVKVWFEDPVRPGWDDFTADIIVAIDNPTGSGLYIPRYDGWDRSDPEAHTTMVLAAIDSSKKRYARDVRLIKFWNRRSSTDPLFSWHIKVLALGCLTTPGTLLDGLVSWFDHATKQVQTGPTPDPAHVGPDIKPAVPKTDAVRLLRNASDALHEAIRLENEDWPVLAHAKLAGLFNDPEVMPAPSPADVRLQEAERLRRRRDHQSSTSAVLVGSQPAVRSWSWSWSK